MFRAQAAKCRLLAGGLTNRDDIRKLEELAREYEERAVAAQHTMLRRLPTAA